MENPPAWPYIMQVFVPDPRVAIIGDAARIAVVGAQLPEGQPQSSVGVEQIKASLGMLLQAAHAQQVLLAADVKAGAVVPSASVMERLQVPKAAGSISTQLYKTCCKSDGFLYEFDRVMANFGHSMKTTLHHDPSLTKYRRAHGSFIRRSWQNFR